MNIGIVCYPTYGGSGVVATELGKALAMVGHKVHFITYSQPTRLDMIEENVKFHNVDINPYPLFEYYPYELALASKLVNVAQTEKLDILHVHYAIPHASAAYMARQILRQKGINIPFVTTLHGTDITLVGKDESYKPVVEFSINESDGVTAVSGSLRDDTLEHFDIRTDIRVIYNFVDRTRFRKQKKDHFKKAIAPHGERLLVHVSNFRKVKRTEDVLEVFLKVKEQVPSKLLFIGDGPEKRKIEALCREYGTCGDVRFLGKLEEIEEVLSVADLFLIPSEKESFGLAALEAMACEVPVVSSNTGGLPELVIDGETGLMSDVGDVEKMTQNALHILKPENLDRFKKNAYQRATQFDLEIIRPQYEAYYHEVLENAAITI